MPPENSLLFYQALRKKKVPSELHIYEKGPHGIGLGVGRGAASAWPEQLAAWLANNAKKAK
jgi:dipeptidyl aminopeptidase/acylaminoacyl peptidase